MLSSQAENGDLFLPCEVSYVVVWPCPVHFVVDHSASLSCGPHVHPVLFVVVFDDAVARSSFQMKLVSWLRQTQILVTFVQDIL